MKKFYLPITDEAERLIALSVIPTKNNGYFTISYQDSNPITGAVFVKESFELHENELSKLGKWINNNIT